MRVCVHNRGAVAAPIVVVPQAWFRNTWSWGRSSDRPSMRAQGPDTVELTHSLLGDFVLHFDTPDSLAFCENDTNPNRLDGIDGREGFFKDGLNATIVDGAEGAVNPAQTGTKVGAIWRRTVAPGAELECGVTHTVSYQPGESDSGLFGGNSNWRGPVWMPVNYLLVESLRKFHAYYGDEFRVEYPTGSGRLLSLAEIAEELSARLSGLFLSDAEGRRPSLGSHPKFQRDPLFREHCLFYEYFHGDDGRGLGASHQTGWTGLIATLLAETESPADNSK